MKHLLMACLLLVFSSLSLAVQDDSKPIVVASKNFNESYLLAELLAQMLESEGYAVERRFGLGGTLVCYEALVNREVDVYVEYTGTVSQAILKNPTKRPQIAVLNQELEAVGLQMLDSLGFNNTYAVALKKATWLSIQILPLPLVWNFLIVKMAGLG